MKIDEVPQDEAYMIKGKIRDVCYALDKAGHYTSALSMGWAPKNDAIKLAWEQVYEKVEEVRRQVVAGRLSPIAFYMEMSLMNIAMLAGHTGISKWKVRKHLKMKHFNRLKPELLSKYAEVLNITAAELVNTERISEIGFKHED